MIQENNNVLANVPSPKSIFFDVSSIKKSSGRVVVRGRYPTCNTQLMIEELKPRFDIYQLGKEYRKENSDKFILFNNIIFKYSLKFIVPIILLWAIERQAPHYLPDELPIQEEKLLIYGI